MFDKILCIDDDLISLMLCRKVAESVEFSKEIITANNGEDAILYFDTLFEEKKNDDFGFRCSREGLFTEIGRMDTLHNNDPDKYIRSYFGDIKRVIDCHESIRNSLNHKDNIQLDTSINILEAKYFSLINKTQFPY